MTYSQSTGLLSIAKGYSGTGTGWNNPAYDHVKRQGPIPRGSYTIGPARDGGRLGPVVFDLTPDPSNQMFGRSLFRIHGDNLLHNASEGCIILDRHTRDLIATMSDRALVVTA